MLESHEIFVRAHTVIPKKGKWEQPAPPKWPDYVLVIDTETTVDTRQKLNFGAYRRCKLGSTGYRCIEEGLFYDDSLGSQPLTVLRRYVDDPRKPAGTEQFPPQIKLKLFSRSDFVKRVFWKTLRRGDMLAGFNLPFDISRLAAMSSPSQKGGWSFVLSLGKHSKDGKLDPNPNRPRIVITSQNSKMAFIGLGSILHKDEWPSEGRFIDLRTLGWALRDKSYSLDRACKKFKVRGKLKHKPTGRVTPREVDYCRRDVRATTRLLNAMKEEFDQHPLELLPDKAYSPASIAKAYLDEMRIAHPKEQFKIADRKLGIVMQSYYGGRAECRIRKTPVPVVYTDFTSQYPTVNALLGNWDVLKAKSVRFEDCTNEIKRLLSNVQLEDTFDPTFWKQLSFFALVQPEQDIFPVRTVYNGRTQNIGLNYLRCEKPIWYAGPDVVSSALLTRKAPRILKAFRMIPRGRQAGLRITNLGGMVRINPYKDDFFCSVIEQKSLHKATNKSLSHFLKILGNSGSYGLFVEINQEKRSKPTNVKIFSGDILRRRTCSDVEQSGTWYFPPLASLITAGGRLLLSMLERCVTDAGGSYLFCDTDSMCIVASEKVGLVPCPGGKYALKDGREAVKAHSLKRIKAFAKKFNALNPYNRTHVREILKIEDINYVNSDPTKPPRQLFGYAISAKRYALYEHTGKNISIIKASGHGLGYLYPPEENIDDDDDEDDDEGAPAWIAGAWDWLLRKEFGSPLREPHWLDLPAMMRMALTSPNVMRSNRPEWLSPYNFFLFPLLSELGGYPAGCDRSNFRFITPFTSNRKKWKNLEGINLRDGRSYRIGLRPDLAQTLVVPNSFRIILRLYLRRLEAKSLAPNGTPCAADTQGLLRRASIVAGEIVPVGKETDRHWEQGEDTSLLDFKVMEYRQSGKRVIADASLRQKGCNLGVREMIRRTKLSQKPIYAILRGQPVRQRTLAIFKKGVDG